MMLLLLMLPLLSGLMCLGLGHYLGRSASQILALSLLGCCFLLSLILFLEVALAQSLLHLKLFN